MTANNGNFYRVIVDNNISGTFVYDDVELANMMYDFFIANRTFIDGKKPEVRIEHVTEYGDVYFTKTRPAEETTMSN